MSIWQKKRTEHFQFTIIEKGHVWRDTRAKAVAAAASNVVLFFQDWMEERTTKWQSPRIHHTAENGLHFQARSCLHFRSIWSHK